MRRKKTDAGRCAGSHAARGTCMAPQSRRSGMIIIIVLVVTVLLSLAAYTFTELMLAEYESAEVSGRGIQSRLMADSGQDYLLQLLSMPQDERFQLVGNLYDNSPTFQGRLVIEGDLPNSIGRFTVLAPRVDEDGNLTGAVRFGLENESARLNLNALLAAEEFQENGGRLLLMSMEEIGMTEMIADSIMDFIDEDDEPREFGAEREYYEPLGVHIPNGPLVSIEQLLDVQGIDGNESLLFGADRNRNFVIDPAEQQYAAMLDAAAYGARGFSAYLTLHSAEKNVQPDGSPRIDLNSDDLETLYADLEELFDSDVATFVIAFRQNGPYTGTMPPTRNSGSLDFEASGGNKLNTVLDLIGVDTQVTFKGQEESVVLKNPWPNPDEQAISGLKEDLPLLFDHCAVNTKPTIPGRLNINQAPRYLLRRIPGLPEDEAEAEEIVDRIITDRVPVPDEDNPDQRHETWLLTGNIVSLDAMKAMMPFITAGGDVYRAQVVGYFEEGGPASRYEIVIDNSEAQPRQMFWRDLSHLGVGFPRATLGIGGQ